MDFESLFEEFKHCKFNEWKTINDWKKNHSASYWYCVKLGLQREIAARIGLSVRINDPAQKERICIEFIKQNNRIPSQVSKDKNEAYLGKLHNHLRTINNVVMYNEKYDEWCNSQGYVKRKIGEYSFEDVKEYYEKNNDFPPFKNPDGSRNKLYSCISKQVENHPDKEVAMYVKSKGWGSKERLVEKKSKPVINDHGKIYKSGKIAAESMSLNKSAVSASITKNYKAGGFHWRYLTDEEIEKYNQGEGLVFDGKNSQVK